MRQTNILLLLLVCASLVFAACDPTITGEAKGGKPGNGGGDSGPTTQCSDGIDNDGDGACDFEGCSVGKGKNQQTLPADSNCDSASDDDESESCVPQAEVCDQQDNDCNGQIDEGLAIECSSASTCGQSGYRGNAYCGADGNVHQDYELFSCSNPGTCLSSCSSTMQDIIIGFCSNGCSNGACNVVDNSTNSS